MFFFKIFSIILCAIALALPLNVSAHLKNTQKSKFGFLVFTEATSLADVKSTGAGWIRPHPGPFSWGNMQESQNADISFATTDTQVKKAQKKGLHILATIWPYAEWDQLSSNNLEECSIADVFVEEIGTYRCPPNDYAAYLSWVTGVVERYDGDGIDDMQDLTIPIKHWEVDNEPDLRANEMSPMEFFVGSAVEYRTLLVETAKTIHAADPEAKVVTAAASGGSQETLDFYREVFKTQQAKDSVDIGNVHCISSNSYTTLNVRPYSKLMDELGLHIPLWVTEAQMFVSEDMAINATQMKKSVHKALSLGADRIFFTSMTFESSGNGVFREPDISPDPNLDPADPLGAYHIIIDKFNN